MTREEILQIAKPILFNTDMVRAITDDRKTATRRIIKCKYSNTHLEMFTNKYGTRLIETQDDVEGETFGKNPDGTTWRKLRGYIETEYERKPYKKGQFLYVRETWSTEQDSDCIASNTGKCPYVSCENAIGRCFEDVYIYKASDNLSEYGGKWHPSIHMPKQAARIFLRVTDVRVERLQDITVDDVLREGVSGVEPPPICIKGAREPEGFRSWSVDKQDDWIKSTARATYIGWCDYADKMLRKMQSLWDSTIKKENMDKFGWNANPWVWVIEFEKLEVQ